MSNLYTGREGQVSNTYQRPFWVQEIQQEGTSDSPWKEPVHILPKMSDITYLVLSLS